MLFFSLIASLTLGLSAPDARAQTVVYPSGDTNHPGTVGAAMQMCPNASNAAVPCGTAGTNATAVIVDGTASGGAAVEPAGETANSTDPSMVMQLAPQSPGIITLGQATKSGSVPVALPSDQLGPQIDALSLSTLTTPTSSATSALSHASVTALGTSLVVKASPGNLYGFNCAGIAGASAGNCIAYNGTTVPGTGALTGANVLDFCTFDTGTKGCSLSRIPMAVNYSTGIVILLSSAASPFTYTTGTDTGAISADYK